MKTIMVLDSRDYINTTKTCEKVTVRAIIMSGRNILLQRDGAGVYKLPGGGVEGEETHEETLAREVLEEVGRRLLTDSLSPIGEIKEIRRDIFDTEVKFVRNTYFYACRVGDEQLELNLTPSEINAGFQALWADIDEVIRVNEEMGIKDWQKRDTQFLKWYRKKMGDLHNG